MLEALIKVDWQGMLVPTTSVAEIVIRGTMIYFAILLLLRIVFKRASSGLAATDVLVIVLIADAAQNGMSADYKSVTEGVVLVATIIMWSYALDWLSYHVPAFQRLLEPQPLLLVEDGRIDRRNLRRELITHDELMAALRAEGLSELAQVLEARMETDGTISIIKRE